MSIDSSIPEFQDASGWDRIAVRISKIRCGCYVCGVEFETYAGMPVSPPRPDTIRTRHDIKPVATCGACYCEQVEAGREQALFDMIMDRRHVPTPAEVHRAYQPKPVPQRNWWDDSDI